jgi:glyoxylase-like metal-dependent hydrolase (beta-lactamase superfamily II)
VVDLGNRHFQILRLPGHSPGSIALYEQATETLFSGDVIYDGALYDTVYRESLERLKSLKVKTIHGGHDQSFGPQRMIEVIEDYLVGHMTLGDPTV